MLASKTTPFCAFFFFQRKKNFSRKRIKHLCGTLASLCSKEVQCGASENKGTLVLGKGVLGSDSDLLASLGLDHKGNIALTARVEDVKKTLGADLVTSSHLVVIGLVDKSQWHNTLLLQVGLVDTGKGLGKDDAAAEVARLQSGVLASRTLTVVVFGNDEPLLTLLLPLLGQSGDAHTVGAGLCVVDIVDDVGLAGLSVDGTDQGVLSNVGQVTLVFEPGTCGGNGVGCALALDLDEDTKTVKLCLGEGSEGLEESKAGGVGVDLNLDAGISLAGGREELGVACSKASGR